MFERFRVSLDACSHSTERIPRQKMAYSYGLIYYYYLLLLFIAIAFGLYVIFAGGEGYFNVGDFLEQTSPYGWAMTGIGLNIGLSVLGAGWRVAVA